MKKLRNKQRKARKKAEQESAQAAQAQVKKDQHHKSRQQGDVEADAPQLDELIPDKLARVCILLLCKRDDAELLTSFVFVGGRSFGAGHQIPATIANAGGQLHRNASYGIRSVL